MKDVRIALLLVALGLGTFACQALQSNTCPPRRDDDTGYLVTICEHILERGLDVSPGEPQAYNILSIEDGKWDGKEADVVYLDCCYMGDVAYMNRQTGEVLSFQLGNK